MIPQLNFWGGFMLSMIFLWWVYLIIFVVGIVIIFINKHIFFKVLGGLIAMFPVSCYFVMFILYFIY